LLPRARACRRALAPSDPGVAPRLQIDRRIVDRGSGQNEGATNFTGRVALADAADVHVQVAMDVGAGARDRGGGDVVGSAPRAAGRLREDVAGTVDELDRVLPR